MGHLNITASGNTVYVNYDEGAYNNVVLNNLEKSVILDSDFKNGFDPCMVTGLEYNRNVYHYCSTRFDPGIIKCIHLFPHLCVIRGFEYVNCKKITSLSYAFEGLKHIANFDFLKNIDVSNITIFSSAFSGCDQIMNLDFTSNWNTKSATTFKYMFWGCNNLSNVDGISNWTVDKVQDFGGFLTSDKLTSINIKKWKISSKANQKNMFMCKKLKTIYASSSFDINKAKPPHKRRIDVR